MIGRPKTWSKVIAGNCVVEICSEASQIELLYAEERKLASAFSREVV